MFDDPRRQTIDRTPVVRDTVVQQLEQVASRLTILLKWYYNYNDKTDGNYNAWNTDFVSSVL